MAVRKPCVSVTKRKAILKDLKQTEESMEAFFNEAAEFNTICKAFKVNGMGWRDMNESCMRQVPTIKESYEKRQAEEAVRKYQEEKEKEEAARIAALDTRTPEKKLLDKIDAGEKLTKQEIRELVYEAKVYTRGENRRWSRTVTSIAELEGRFFQIEWEEGLTENQEDEFYSQPFEVVRHEYEKTIIVTEWKKKE